MHEAKLFWSDILKRRSLNFQKMGRDIICLCAHSYTLVIYYFFDMLLCTICVNNVSSKVKKNENMCTWHNTAYAATLYSWIVT